MGKSLSLMAIGLALPWLMGQGLQAQPERPQPPQRRTQYFDPDPRTCQPETITTAFRTQMLPWADQPEAVQARLRRLQGEMAAASLRRCIKKGLMTPAQARTLARELGLVVPSTPGKDQPQQIPDAAGESPPASSEARP